MYPPENSRGTARTPIVAKSVYQVHITPYCPFTTTPRAMICPCPHWGWGFFLLYAQSAVRNMCLSP